VRSPEIIRSVLGIAEMISAVLREGDSFYSGISLAVVDFPVLPRVGELITLPGEQRFVVKAIDHHQHRVETSMEVHILVEHVSRAAPHFRQA
jgi:hypothetical protein